MVSTRAAPCRAALLIVAALPFTGPLVPAGAQDLPPPCGPQGRGMLACMAGEVCTCDWFRGGSITDQRPGWRWSCRIEQMCGAPAPADTAPGWPPSTDNLGP